MLTRNRWIMIEKNGANITDISLTDLKRMSFPELMEVAKQLRSTIVDAVSKNGGHLASNLGLVEATIVLHRVFNSPNDKIVFDVSHQCYAHKILTGRGKEFDSLRKYGGLSGFTNRFESEHDALNEGHSGASVSAALGIAEANKLQGKDDYAVAVVGDGSLTNGMVYEALNNCAGKKLNLIVVINDNEMSISKNVGGLHKYLSSIRTSKGYFSFKRGLGAFLSHIPLLGKPLVKFCRWVKEVVKSVFVRENLFEDMGLEYLGPVDGHDMEKLTVVLEEAKTRHCPCVVHIKTKKGKGYAFAEEHPEYYHSVAPFDVEKGVSGESKNCFSLEMGRVLCERAKSDDKICAITAAMCDGTGLTEFATTYPDRFFDVGIAEEHAVTFAGGLALQGMKPVLILYSTFAQRSFDQLFHDISIQKLPLVLALDRSGIVSGDGVTHQGIFDYALFSTLPNVTIYSPESYEDLSNALDKALLAPELSIVRYPKGGEDVAYETEEKFMLGENGDFSYTQGVENDDVVLLSYGRISRQAYEAMKILREKHTVGLIKLKKIFPLDFNALSALMKNAKLVYVLEEGMKQGGVVEKLALGLGTLLPKTLVHGRAIEEYVQHGSLSELMQECGFNATQVALEVENALDNLEE